MTIRNAVRFLSSLTLVVIVFFAGNSSCSKPAPAPPTPVDTTTNPPADTTHTTDTTTHPPSDTSTFAVYVGGQKFKTEGWDYYPAYWKNDTLKQASTTISSFITSIYVRNKDVYYTTAGNNYANSFSYWKNDTGITSPPDELGYGHAAYGITMMNDDVYTTGTAHQSPDLNYCAVYQISNRDLVYLAPPSISVNNSWGYAIAAVNNDMYVAGHFGYKAAYWKNGQKTMLPADSTYGNYYSRVNSICANNGDIYMAGTIATTGASDASYDVAGIAAYWLNDSLIRLTADTPSCANAIAVVNGDVYVAGSVFSSDRLTSKAAYWKNGVLHLLNDGYSEARAIAVHGSDIYIAGTINFDQAVYWKNEVLVSLGRGQATSIFITN